MPSRESRPPKNRSTRGDGDKRRKIHVDLSVEVHRKLRVKAALQDVSMQAFVARVVDEAVRDVVMPTAKSPFRGKRA